MIIQEYNGHKYQVNITDDEKVITATSSFGGKIVQGIAKCHPDDVSNTEKFIELAILRCDAKIADKKVKRGAKKLQDAEKLFEEAKHQLENATSYMNDAEKFYNRTMLELEAFEAAIE